MPSNLANRTLKLRHSARIFLGLLLAVFFIQCDEEGKFNPVGPPSRLVFITEITAPSQISAGGADAEITGRVVDQNNAGYKSAIVSFSAVDGVITAADTTNNEGRFSAFYQSGTDPGVDTVTVSSLGARAQVLINVVGISAELSISVSRTSILANGMDTVRVIALLVGREGAELNRIPIRFETTDGDFNGQRITYAGTNVEGKTEALLTSASSTTTVSATVTASIEEQEAGSGNQTPAPAGVGKRAVSRTAGTDAVSSTRVTMRGVAIRITADPTLIPGDGQAQTQISVSLKEENRQAVPNATVTFSALHGNIPVSARTDASGVALVNLTSAALPGEFDLVVARFGPELADSTLVEYAPAVDRIEMSTDQNSYLADGIKGTKIIASVYGGTGEPAPGIEVSFRADAGTIMPETAITDADGNAETTIIGPLSTSDLHIIVTGEVDTAQFETSLSIGEVNLVQPDGLLIKTHLDVENAAILLHSANHQIISEATSAPAQETGFSGSGQGAIKRRADRSLSLQDFSAEISVLARGVRMRLSSDPDSIIARRDAAATISAEVFEFTSGNPVVGDTVRFATSEGSIPGSAILDNEGKAEVILTAGDIVGRAKVRTTFGSGLQDSIFVEFLPAIGTIEVQSDKYTLLAGGIDTARVTVSVGDALGGTAANVPVLYEISNDSGNVRRIYTDNAGRAQFMVVSPSVEEDMMLTVTITSGNQHRQVDLGINSITRRITAIPDSLSAGSNNPAEIIFRAFESSTNRPVAGDTVWFSASGGIVQPNGVLDLNGSCRTQFQVNDVPGTALVIGRLGSLNPDTVRLELVEAVAVIRLQPDRASILCNGIDSTLITARVTNLLNQPAPGVRVEFGCNAGSVFPPAALTDESGQISVVYQPPAGSRDTSVVIYAVAQPSANSSTATGEMDQPEKASSPSRSLNVEPVLTGTDLHRHEWGISAANSTTFSHTANPVKPRLLNTDEVTDSIRVALRGVTLNMNTFPRSIRADGHSKSAVNVQLVETTSGEAIADATVNFGASLGSIRASGITDDEGRLSDSLRAGVVTGTSLVRAAYGNGISCLDSVILTPDPARLSLDISLDPDVAGAGDQAAVTANATILQENREPAEGIEVRFVFDGQRTVLSDPAERLRVSRWENTFNVTAPEAVEALLLHLQIKGVDTSGTRLFLNRNEIENIQLPHSPFWRDLRFEVPPDNLNEGINRIEIAGGNMPGGVDRFSVAGVRVALAGDHEISLKTTDGEGFAEAQVEVDRTAGVRNIRVELTDDPARFDIESLTIMPADPASILVASELDSILASGVDEAEISAVVTDEFGNNSGEGIAVSFEADPSGEIDPDQVRTLGDGTASTRYLAPARAENEDVRLQAQSGEIEGSCPVFLHGVSLDLTAQRHHILADGESRLPLEAQLHTADGDPVPNRRISFRASSGVITAAAVTNNNGVATANLTAADHPDTAIVTATFGAGFEDSIEIVFSPLVNRITISPDRESIRGDGIDSTAITTCVFDGIGNPASHVDISLTAEGGRLDRESATTDQNGEAVVYLFGDAVETDDSVKVFAVAEGYDVPDSTTVRLRGLTLAAQASPARLPANNTSTSTVTVRLTETSNGNPVPQGRVRFSTDLGRITAGADLSENGTAQAVFTAPENTGTATITVIYGDEIRSEVEIELVERVARLNLDLSPLSIRGDGLDSTTLIVTALDGVGENAEGIIISLAALRGSFSNGRITTDADGHGEVKYFGPAVAVDDSVEITAAVDGHEIEDSAHIRLRGITLEIEASPDSLPANGVSTSRITARVIETSSGNPVEEGRIRFSTSFGSIPSSANLALDGTAQAVYTAASDTGRAVVVARFGHELSAVTGIVLVDRAAEMSLTVSPASILADGERESRVIVRMTDPWGGAAPRELVNLNFEGPGSLHPLLGYTDQNGELTAIARGSASTSDGRLLVTSTARSGAFRATEAVTLRGVTLSLRSSSSLIAGDGRSISVITARVRETTSGHAVSQDTVFFSTSAGVIPAWAILDDAGEAAVQLRSDEQAAIAAVTAWFGNRLQAGTAVAFANRYSYLDLSTERGAILADGVDSVRISATLRDTLSNPVSGEVVYLTVTENRGTLSADSAVTDNNGRSAVYLRSAASDIDLASNVTANIGELASETEVEMRGVEIRLSADPEVIPANGIATSTLSVQVSEVTNGNPVTGRSVFFSTNAGVITAATPLDDQGRASGILTAPENPGEATVRADFGRMLSTSTTVNFIQTIGSVTLVAAEGAIIGDGVDEVQLTATVRNPLDNPVPDVTVRFNAPNGGSLSRNQQVTNQDGEAVVTFRGIATRSDRSLPVTAVADGGAADEIDIDVLGITVQMTATPNRLPANGAASAEIRVSAFETEAHTAVTDREIRFSADRGSIGRSAVLDDNGNASVNYTCPVNPGEARISAVLGDSLRVIMGLPLLVSEPRHAAFSIDPATISVSGIGRRESANLTVEITDAGNYTVPDGSEITLQITPDIGVRFENGQVELTAETENGSLVATVVAGEEVGSVRFRALSGDDVLATGGELIILAGPPSRMTVRANIGIIYFPGGMHSAFPVSAAVMDAFSNPVEDSTAVRFRLEPDDIAQITPVGYTVNGVVFTELNFPLGINDYFSGVWLTYPNDAAGEEVLIHATASGGEVAASTRVILPGALQGGEPDRITASVDSSSIIADGRQQTSVRARLEDGEGRPVADMTEVRFSADLGSLQSPLFTAGGEVISVYTAGRTAGIDTIRISSGEVNDQVALRLRAGVPSELDLTISDEEVRANGIDFTTVEAEVRDQYGNLANTGTIVTFSSSMGEISQFVETDVNGIAATRLTAGRQTGEVRVSAVSGAASDSRIIRFVSGDANSIVLLSIDRNTIGVRGSGSPESATLIFEVQDDRGVPVDEFHSVNVEFSLEGPARVVDPDESSADSVAFLDPLSAETDAQGRVITTLNSGFFAGALGISVVSEGGISGEAIAVAIHGGAPDADHFALSALRCVATGLEGTPTDTVTITAHVGDRFSNPTVEGTIIRFSTTGGIIEGSARTDTLGSCSVLLTTARPEPIGGIDSIFAQTIDWQDEEINALATVIVTGPTEISIDLDEDWEIPYGGFQDFVFTIADGNDHPLVAGSTIQISADGLTPTGEDAAGLQLTGTATTEPVTFSSCSQITEFNVRLFNYVNGLNGASVNLRANVTSPNGDREFIHRGRALGQVLSTEDSRVRLTPEEIAADGQDECTVLITVYDTLGIAIPGVHADQVAVSVTGGNPLVTPPAADSDAQGRTTATVVGREVGQGNVLVRIDGQLLADQPLLTFNPGPPARIAVNVEQRRLVVGGEQTNVTVNVTDENGNPTVNGTNVEFSAVDASFTPAFTQTVNGSASTVYRSGLIAGPATFTVTASHRGTSIEQQVINIQFLPGPPGVITLNAANYSVRAGSQVDVSITVEDEYGNSVANNTEIEVSVEPAGRGSVSPESVRTDDQGQATVTFSAGTTAGQTARVTAAAGDASGQTPNFTFTPGPPGRVTMTADPDSLEVGGDVNLDVLVVDTYDNPVSDTTRVTFSTSPDVGILTPSVINSRNGVAASVLSGVTVAGDLEAVAQAGEIIGSVRIRFMVGEVSSISVVSTPNLVNVNQSSTITATAEDRFGNPVQGVDLGFSITAELTDNPGECRLHHDSRTTNINGRASTVFTAGNSTGSAIISVTFGDEEGLTFVDIVSEG